MPNLVLHHELKNFLDYRFRRLMCELIHDNINMFIVKMMIYISKLKEVKISYFAKETCV